jgi:hypothetical protein
MKDSKRKSKSATLPKSPVSILDFTNSREYYGVVVRGVLQPDAENPYLYKMDEVDLLRADYPRGKIVKIRMTYHVIAEVTL